MHDDERAIRDLIKRWIEASEAGDTNAVLELMAEDVVFLTPGQRPMRGRSTFARAMQQMEGMKLDAKSEVVELQLLGDWAYVWTKLSVTARAKHSLIAIERAGHTLSILKKQAGAWVIFRDANMLAVKEK